MAVNVRGYVLTMRAAIPLMLERGGGTIVNTSSDAAFGTLLHRPAYGAAKAAVNALTRHVASRWGPHGVRCNAIAPGVIETPQSLDPVNSLGPDGVREFAARVPVRRNGLPEDIAHTFLFLASEEASFLTGQVLLVDGGVSLSLT